MGIPFAQGIRMMVDDQQRFIRAGLEVFLRLQNFKSEGDFQEMGVPYVPSGTEAAKTGFTDILIDPPPQVVHVSMHDIGMSGGKLLLGARNFIISHTFVLNMRDMNPNIMSDSAVWNSFDGKTPVLGIMYAGLMHEIATYSNREIAGETISWTLTCNRVVVPQDPGAEQPKEGR